MRCTNSWLTKPHVGAASLHENVTYLWFCPNDMSFQIIKKCQSRYGHSREPCNVDAHGNIPDLFMTMLCPRLCVHMYCTHCTLYSCLLDRSEHCIHPGDTTHDTHKTHTHKTHTDTVKCWARVQNIKSLKKTQNDHHLAIFQYLDCCTKTPFDGRWSLMEDD